MPSKPSSPIVNAPEPPKHLLLGRLALTRFRKRLDDWKTELDTWQQSTVGADFPEGEDTTPSAQASTEAPATAE